MKNNISICINGHALTEAQAFGMEMEKKKALGEDSENLRKAYLERVHEINELYII
jgi:hypothetical protein